MSLLSTVQAVCAVVGVEVPTSVFTNITYNRTMTEFLALANECAQRIAYDTRDWTKFRKSVTLQGDGVTSAFDLPADFKRMLLKSNVWRSTSTLEPMKFVPDTDEWLNRRSMPLTDAWGEWTNMNGQIHIQPIMGPTVTAYFPYVHKNCINLFSGGINDAFMDDRDSFALDERLLKLCMTWQWKAQKGSPYQEDLSNYGDALMQAMGHDSPAPIILQGKPYSWGTKVAYPFPVPTP